MVVNLDNWLRINMVEEFGEVKANQIEDEVIKSVNNRFGIYSIYFEGIEVIVNIFDIDMINKEEIYWVEIGDFKV